MANFCKVCGGPVSESDYMCMTCGSYLDVEKKKTNKKKQESNKKEENTSKRSSSPFSNFVTDNPIAVDLIVAIFSLLMPALSILFIFFYGYRNKRWVVISLTCVMIRFVLAVFGAALGAI